MDSLEKFIYRFGLTQRIICSAYILHIIGVSKMSGSPISLRLPDKMNRVLDMLADELHTTKSKLIKEAIAERIEDYLDVKTIDEIVARNEPTISHEELKRELSL